MTHKERMALAAWLCRRVVARHAEDVVVCGVYGSTASATDTPWSDLELLFVVRNGFDLKPRQFLYRGTAVGLVVKEQAQLEKSLGESPFAWEYWMGVLSMLRVLHGSPEQVQRWLEMGQAVPADRLRAALEASLSWLVVESFGRVRSSRQRGSLQDAGWAVLKLLSEMRLALCLLNHRWVTHNHYQGLLDTFAFPKLPEGYRRLVPALLSAGDTHEAVSLAETLVNKFRELLVREGIRLPADYQTVEELPL